MIKFTATIQKFDRQGEKSGWTYITIPAAIAAQLFPGNKKSFRVKGKLEGQAIQGIALLPMGEGDFIMALNAGLRKVIGKKSGAVLYVELTVDTKQYQINAEFLQCLEDEPAALAFFKNLPMAHQHYFSKWIESAKTGSTKIKRIAKAVSALSRKMGFPDMQKASRAENEQLGGAGKLT